jgi:RNA polymerase sigma factor (sigma-70 family)
MSDEREEALARLAAGGDRAALEELLGLIRPRVLRRCSRFLPCYQDAEEACQDVLLRVARGTTGFRSRSKFSTWLHVIIANSARQTYRTLSRQAREEAYAEPPQDRPDRRTTSVIAGSRLDFLDALDRLEARRPELVAAFVLRDVFEFDYREIAAHLGIPEGTVKSRIHQARADMRDRLFPALG